MTVGDLLKSSATRNPDKDALVFESERRTYSQLLDRVDRLASALLELGLQEGDRVGVYLYNCIEAYESLLATARAGLLFVPLNYMLNGAELAKIASDAGIRALIVAPELFPTFEPVASDVSSLNRIIGVGGGAEGTLDYETLLSHRARPANPGAVTGQDLFGLMYTSGTTGLPKGVMLTHRNIVTHARNMVRDYGIGESSVGMIALPYFVGASLNGIGLPCLSQGGTVVISGRFTPEGFLQTIQGKRVTHVQVVPTLLVRLLESDAPGRYDASSLEVFGYGSAPMPEERLVEALETFGPIFAQMYGLTETCAMATCLTRDDHSLEGPERERLKSCGKPVDGVEVRIVDETGAEVPDGEIGELVIRGPTVMQGYWGRPDLTSEAMDQGWFRSGDLGYRGREGYIFLNDRKKDLIVTGGFNVFPREIEEVLYAHPAVSECAVIGRPDPEWGEAVTAFVALKKGRRSTEDELLQFCSERLSRFKRPKSVSFVNEIPRNPSGKVLKRLLRKQVS